MLPSQPFLTWSELEDRRAKGEQIMLLDVRDHDEWGSGSLPGAEHIPLGSLEFKVWQGAYPKNATIVVYCQTDKRAAHAQKLFLDRGYDKVLILKGGYLAATT